MSRASQDGLSQADLYFYRMLALDPDYEYGVDDLKDSETLHRAYRLLFQAKFGQDTERLKLTPHVTYNKLLKRTCGRVKELLEVEEKHLEECRNILRNAHSK